MISEECLARLAADPGAGIVDLSQKYWDERAKLSFEKIVDLVAAIEVLQEIAGIDLKPPTITGSDSTTYEAIALFIAKVSKLATQHCQASTR